MRRRLLRLLGLAIGLLLWCAVPATAADKYVDNSCVTNGNGSTTTCGASGPFNDLQSALDTAAADDVFIIRNNGGGDYVTTSGSGYSSAVGFSVGASGTSGHPITIRNYVGERPILRACTSASTTLAACNRATITAFNQSYVVITSDSCPSSGSPSMGLHVYGLVILYDDGTTEGTMANGNEVSCTEVERGYSTVDDGNWSAIWTQGQLGVTIRRNYIHDIEVETLTGPGGQSSRAGIKTFQTSNSTISNNTIDGVAPSSSSQFGVGIDCKADCVTVTMHSNDIRNVSICLRVENQETGTGPYTTNGATGSVFRNSLCVSSASSVRGGVRFEGGRITDIAIYNNTFVDFIYGLEETHPQPVPDTTPPCGSITHYNNAYYNTTDLHIDLSDSSGVECTFTLSDYNIYGTAASSPRYKYAGASNTLANYQSASGFDAASTELAEASFGFTNAAGGDYTLGAMSALQSAGRVGGSGSTAEDVGAYTDSITCIGHLCGAAASPGPIKTLPRVGPLRRLE